MKNNNERNVLHERGGVHEYIDDYIKIRQNNVSFLCLHRF